MRLRVLATRFGLVWEADDIERDRALNTDFVALDLVSELVMVFVRIVPASTR
ncbi:MAG TPA: hypothetical protein PKE26_12340 [Kiritimatiellia bacterium]|nr:hypothetical protein [Kiritimatiellia bacterium]HMO99889.1 hypothetical protein [Kiritimatiellia bacterium]